MSEPSQREEENVAEGEPSRDVSRALFGRYRVMARLGRGGMAEVFVTAAEGAAGVRKLAVVKRLRADLVKDEDPEAIEAAERFRAMFLAEAQLSARLNHPNIVHTYEVGEESGSLFIAMEYVEGQSLHSLQSALKRAGKGIPAGMSVRIVCEVLSGLHYAHELTDIVGDKLVIVHRDVSPQNVMLTYDGGVKLVDFGVAKASYSSAATEIGTMKGKVRYMAPEQVAGASVDRRADLFAAGVVLWELLAQKRLTRGATDAQALLALVRDEPPSLLAEAPAIDPALAAVVMRALSREPEQRYQTALAMRTALEAALAGSGEHVTSESIGALVANTFAEARQQMSERVRRALSRTTGPIPDGPVVDWGSEASIAESGASRSRSASRSINQPNEPATLSTVHDLQGFLGTPPVPMAVAPPSRRKSRSPILLPLFMFLAAAGGAGAVILTGGSRAAPAPAPAVPSAPPAITAQPLEEHVLPVMSAIAPEPVTSAVPVVAAKPEAGYDKSAKSKSRDAKSESEGGKRETAPAPAEASEKGFLTLDTFPWTKVLLNGRVLGTTPLIKSALPPGTYTLSLENPDEKISEHTTVTIKAGETVSKRIAF